MHWASLSMSRALFVLYNCPFTSRSPTGLQHLHIPYIKSTTLVHNGVFEGYELPGASPLYVATLLSRLSGMSGEPHTIVSNSYGVKRDNKGVGITRAMPDLTADTCASNSCSLWKKWQSLISPIKNHKQKLTHTTLYKNCNYIIVFTSAVPR